MFLCFKQPELYLVKVIWREGARFIITERKGYGPLGWNQGTSFKIKVSVCADFLLPYILPVVDPYVGRVFLPLSKASVVRFPAEGTNPPELQGNCQNK